VSGALIAGNWKMNLVREEGVRLVEGILAGAKRVPAERELLVLPPYTLLASIAGIVRGTRIGLGAQDLHWERSGAYTSGISAAMVRDAGCDWALVGHSERRDHFGDRGDVLQRKLRAALAADLRVIYCIGEHLEDREAGRTEAVLATQFDEVLVSLTAEEMARVTLAYEPVWAIGTGRTATPETAQEVHATLRARLVRHWGAEVAARVRILYGGSVTAENAASLLRQPDLNGVLVGGASLKVESFLGIASA
jgi:triosephosphate isomerase